jgi:hypothetical protein
LNQTLARGGVWLRRRSVLVRDRISPSRRRDGRRRVSNGERVVLALGAASLTGELKSTAQFVFNFDDLSRVAPATASR